ncbi:MAG: TolC family protein [Opitutaceae bacterium]|nr:TolC family protein [Opitutaceae bacterium]
MPTHRRISALFIFAVAAIAGLAEPAAGEAGADEITLDDAIRRALAKNFSIQVQGFDAAIAAARVTEALGKFDPALNGSYTFSQDRNPLLSFTPAGQRNTTVDQVDTYDVSVGGLLPWGMTYRLGASTTNARGTFNAYADNYESFAGASGSLPLLRNFGFGPTLASIRIAMANRGISAWQYRAAAIDLITAVTFAYHDLNLAYANLRSAIRSRELAASLLAENEKRFRVGSMSEFDVNSARSRVANREEAILLAQRAVGVAENALKQLITDERSPALLQRRLVIVPPPTPPIVVVDAAADFRTALAQRPDYAQARLALQRDGINARLQRNQLLPRVDLVGSYGYNGYDAERAVSRHQVQDQEYKSYSWGVVVSVPLSLTTERGRYRAARLQQRQSETELARIEQDIVVRVGNAAGQIETTQQRIQAAREARALAQTILDAEVKRLRAGQSSTFFVLQQQEIVSSLEVSESRALSDYAKALAEYDRQLGVTLERLRITVEPPR